MCVYMYVCMYVYIYIYTHIRNNSMYLRIFYAARGGVVVKAIRYKPAGRGFDSRWCHCCHSGRTMALGSTQPLTETSTGCISWG